MVYGVEGITETAFCENWKKLFAAFDAVVFPFAFLHQILAPVDYLKRKSTALEKRKFEANEKPTYLNGQCLEIVVGQGFVFGEVSEHVEVVIGEISDLCQVLLE